MGKDIAETIAAMTVEEKASLCSGLDGWHTKPVPRLGVGSVRMADGPNGLRYERPDGEGGTVTESATCFPCGCLTACSFDVELMGELGRALAVEARDKGVDLLLAPGVNIKRSPLCGRNFEYLSEDPLLAGEMAAAYVSSMQRHGVGATLKHFALNNQEKARLSSDSVADERARREIYLAPFETVVKKARPWAVMSAYNKADGVYTSENEALRDVLRDDWAYDGVYMSDWGAINDRVRGLRAGLDLEMPGSGGFYDRILETAVGDGTLEESALDTAARHVLALERTAVDARRTALPKADPDAQHQLARRFAAQSMVLLKNEENLLPLDGGKQRVAVVGAFAQQPRFQGGGAANIHPTRRPAFLDILPAHCADYSYAAGYDAASGLANRESIEQAVTAAKDSDVVLLLAGLPNAYESEGYDRPDMRLPQSQNDLIAQVAQANANTVVLLFAGGPVEMPWIDAVSAVLMCYLPGQAGAEAAADILFGAVSPSGKLPETFPLKLADAPCFPYFGQENIIFYRESVFVGYRYYGGDRPVLFPFGHGLSYSSFRYSDIDVRQRADGGADVRFELENTGAVAAAEAPQLYVAPPAGAVFRPEFELKAFCKVLLQPGQKQTVRFTLDPHAFAFYNTLLGDWQVLPGRYTLRVGSSSRDIRLTADLTLAGTHPEAPLPDWRDSAPEYYDLDRIAQVPDASFQQLLGRPLPVYSPTPFHRNSTLKELRATALGRRIDKMVRDTALGAGDAGPQEGQDLRVMLEAQADYLPLHAIVAQTQGAVSYDMLDALLLIMNKKRVKGAFAFLRALRKPRDTSTREAAS